MDAQQYLTEIKSKLIASPIVESFSIVEERDLQDRGYFRARVTLTNTDFLEIAEYFVIIDDNPSQTATAINGWIALRKHSASVGITFLTFQIYPTFLTMSTSMPKITFKPPYPEASQNF